MTDPYNSAKPKRDPWAHVPVKKDRRQKITRIDNPVLKLRKPRLGDVVSAYGRPAKIMKLHGMGTVDAQTADGKWYRITGLPIADIDIPMPKVRRKNPLDLMTALNAAGDLAMMAEFNDEKKSGAFKPKRRKNPYGEGKCPPHLKKFRFRKTR